MGDQMNQGTTESHNASAPDDHQPSTSESAMIPQMEDVSLKPEGAESDNKEEEGEKDDNENPLGNEEDNAAISMPTDDARPRGRCPALVAWLKSNAFLIYCSQFFSAWGDRMWTFAVALFLVEIEDNSLRLTAVFGFALTISVLLFGTLVGQWVDRTSRLSATRQSLVIQNSGVIINAICLLILLHYKTEILPIGNGSLYVFCQMVIIVLGVLANLASVAEKICIQKDWVVVLAGDDSEHLAEMNATVRRIDLTVNILAPILVGQIMTFAGMTVAGIFIAAWNLCSLILEYTLLLRVYKRVPRLAVKLRKEPDGQIAQPEAATESSQADCPAEAQAPGDVGETEQVTTDYKSGDPEEASPGWIRLQEEAPEDLQPGDAEVQVAQPSSKPTILRRIANWFISYYGGWQIYRFYPVHMAGLALAFLYMTVMGFDSITNGYGYTMGLSEAMLGGIRGLGSVAGIVGTFIYQRLRQRIGATRTGLYALSEEILCLLLCIISVWAAGSPFNPQYFFDPPNSPTVEPTNGTWNFSTVTPGDTMGNTPQAAPNDVNELISYASPVLFFTGMVTSRIGLWMFDLVTTQLIQENVQEDQRGVFSGVQRSLECSMDMLHFILVIILPRPETFGFLIILSFIFICTGAVLYCVFSFRERGHLFHTEKLTQCLHQNGDAGMTQFHDEEENESDA